MECKDCPYCYCGDNDIYPHCHYETLGDWDPAPCEYVELATMKEEE